MAVAALAKAPVSQAGKQMEAAPAAVSVRNIDVVFGEGQHGHGPNLAARAARSNVFAERAFRRSNPAFQPLVRRHRLP